MTISNPQGKTSELVETAALIATVEALLQDGARRFEPSKEFGEDFDRSRIKLLGDWKGLAPALLSRLRGLEEENGKLRADLAEADQRAGEAERLLAWGAITASGKDWWLQKAKAARGYSDNTSFDLVWKETCAKADKAGAIQSLNVEAVGVLEELDQLREGCAPDELGAVAGSTITAFVAKYRSLLSRLQSGSENKGLGAPGSAAQADAATTDTGADQ